MATLAQLKAEVSVTGVEASTAKLGAFGKAVDKTGAASGAAAPKLMSHEQAMSKLGTAGLVGGGLLVAGFGLAIGAAAGFDKAMSGVGAVSDASAKDMGRLRDAALDAGKATVFSASEAAQAEAELAKAGVSTADILGGALRGSLDLAAAGQLDLGEAATIAAQAMNIFKLEGSDVGHIADVLAAGANKSAADVSELGQALGNGGLAAKSAGETFDHTVGVLSLFADKALKGAEGGTQLKSMMLALQNPSAEAATTMRQLGIDVYDAAGKFVGFDALAGNLKSSLKDLTQEQRNQALATVFGSFAVQGANVLYAAGAKGVKKYEAAVNDSGAASRMAGKQLDNLSGDFEQLQGSIETALIQGGSGATNALRGITQQATAAVNAFIELPAPVQQAVVGFAGVAGGGLLVVGAVGTMVPKVKEGVAAFKSMKEAASNLPGALGKIGSAAGTVAVGVGTFIAVYVAMQKVFDDSRSRAKSSGAELLGGLDVKTFDGITKGLDRTREAFRGIQHDLRPSKGTGGSIAEVWQDINPWVDNDIEDMVQKGAQYKKMIAEMKAARGRLSEGAGKVRSQLGDMFGGDTIAKAWLTNDVIQKVANSLGVDLSAKGAAGKQAVLAVSGSLNAQTSAAYGTAGSLGAIGAAAGDAAQQLDKFKKTMDSLLGVHLDATSAEIKYRDSLDALTKSVVDNGLTFNLNTDAGRRNTDAFIAASKAAEDHAIAVGKTSAGVAGANLVMQAEIGKLGETAKAFGLTDAEALTYMEDLYGIPADVRTEIHSTADLARLLVQGLAAEMNGIDGKTANTSVHVDISQAQASLNAFRLQLIGITSVYTALGHSSYGGHPADGNAAGGLIGMGNNLTWVGEQGKELVRLPTGSQVYSNVASNRMIRDSTQPQQTGSVTYVTQEFSVPPNVNMIELGRVTQRALDAYSRVSVR